MGFRTGAYAKVWKIEQGKYGCRAQISVSRKNQDTGEYKTTFSGFVNLSKAIEEMIKDGQLQEGDRIRIGDCDTCNEYDKEKKVTYWNCYLYSLMDSDAQQGPSAPAPVPEVDDEEDPF